MDRNRRRNMDNEIETLYETNKMTSQSETSKLSGLGARLRKARESMHLTQKEAAARLYLNAKIVEVIENEAFFDGPPLTFMRGYLRSYARLLNFPESEIKTAIDELELNSSPTTLTAPSLQANPTYRGDRYIRWITYLIVLTLISLVVLWWSSHSKYVIADVPSANLPPKAANTTIKPTETLPSVSPQSTNPTSGETQTPSAVPQSAQSEPLPTTHTPDYTAPQITQPATVPAPLPTTPATTSAMTLPGPIVVPTTSDVSAAVSGETEPKPKSVYKKKHKRHQYHPIENMDIPEPD